MIPNFKLSNLLLHSWNRGSVIVVLLLMILPIFSLLDKDFMLLFVSIRSLLLLSWKFVILIVILIIMLPTLFSLLDKDFMLPFGIMKYLWFQILNYESILHMLLFMIPALWYFLHTLIYIFSNKVVLFYTTNSLVLHQHQQNIQLSSQNLMLNQIISSVGVNVPLHIPDVPDITSLANICTVSASKVTHTPRY